MSDKSLVNKDRIVWCLQGFYPIRYGYCPNKKAWEAYLLGIKEFEGVTPYPTGGSGRMTAFFSEEWGHEFIVTLNPKLQGDDLLGFIIHEAVHVWQYFVKTLRINPETDREVEAYSIQAIAIELVKAHREYHNQFESKS